MRRRRRSLVRSSTQTQSDFQQHKVRRSYFGTPHKLGSISPTRRGTVRNSHAVSILTAGAPPSTFSAYAKPFRPLTPTYGDIRQRAMAKSKSKSSKEVKKDITPITRKKRSPNSAAASAEAPLRIVTAEAPLRIVTAEAPLRIVTTAADPDENFLSGRERVHFNDTSRRSSARQCSASSPKKGKLLPTPKKTHGVGLIPSLARRIKSEYSPLFNKMGSERGPLASIRAGALPSSRTQRRHSDTGCYDTPLTIDDFTLIGSVGHGSFGKVLLAHLKGSKRNYVAIKGIAKRRVVRKVDILRQEVANLKQSLPHPFILSLYAVLQDSEFVYIVTEHVPGGTLENLLQHFQRWNKTKLHKGNSKKGFTPAVPLKLVCFYTAQITQALGFLHKQNILYNDLKLENVLVQMDGYCKLIDLGLSYKIESKDDLLPLCGTPANMAPEVVRTGAATGTRVNGFDKTVDWWALGVLMYHLYFGLHPFDWGDGMKASFIRILKGDVQFPAQSVSSKSCSDKGKAALRDLVQRLLCVDRDKRIGNGESGTADVQSHTFFKELIPNTNGGSQLDLNGMWVQLEKKLINTPFLPREHRADCEDKTFTLLKRRRRHSCANEGAQVAKDSSRKSGAVQLTPKADKVDITASLPELTQKQQALFYSQLQYFVNESWFRR